MLGCLEVCQDWQALGMLDEGIGDCSCKLARSSSGRGRRIVLPRLCGYFCCLYIYTYINMYYLSIYLCADTLIRRPLPERERARLQLQSPMPSNPASPKPSNPDTPRGIRASKHPSIPDCRNPLFDRLKGATAPPRRGPQAFSARQTSSPHMLPFAPLGPQIDAPACTGVPNSSLEHPV